MECKHFDVDVATIHMSEGELTIPISLHMDKVDSDLVLCPKEIYLNGDTYKFMNRSCRTVYRRKNRVIKLESYWNKSDFDKYSQNKFESSVRIPSDIKNWFAESTIYAETSVFLPNVKKTLYISATTQEYVRSVRATEFKDLSVVMKLIKSGCNGSSFRNIGDIRDSNVIVSKKGPIVIDYGYNSNWI